MSARASNISSRIYLQSVASCCAALLAIFLIAALLFCSSHPAPAAEPEEAPRERPGKEAAERDAEKEDTEYEQRSVRGRVVWMADALERRFDVSTTADARQNIIGFETEQGALYPLVEDMRGRAFRKDERLRERPLELLVRQFEGSPMLQVIRIYALKEDGKYELDYWCDICAIAMFELKPCDCCQGPVELRERKVEQ